MNLVSGEVHQLGMQLKATTRAFLKLLSRQAGVERGSVKSVDVKNGCPSSWTSRFPVMFVACPPASPPVSGLSSAKRILDLMESLPAWRAADMVASAVSTTDEVGGW